MSSIEETGVELLPRRFHGELFTHIPYLSFISNLSASSLRLKKVGLLYCEFILQRFCILLRNTLYFYIDLQVENLLLHTQI